MKAQYSSMKLKNRRSYMYMNGTRMAKTLLKKLDAQKSGEVCQREVIVEGKSQPT